MRTALYETQYGSFWTLAISLSRARKDLAICGRGRRRWWPRARDRSLLPPAKRGSTHTVVRYGTDQAWSGRAGRCIWLGWWQGEGVISCIIRALHLLPVVSTAVHVATSLPLVVPCGDPPFLYRAMHAFIPINLGSVVCCSRRLARNGLINKSWSTLAKL